MCRVLLRNLDGVSRLLKQRLHCGLVCGGRLGGTGHTAVSPAFTLAMDSGSHLVW